jgi:hypothetical protein
VGVEGPQAPEQGCVVVLWDFDLTGDPAEEVSVGHLDQALELVQIFFREVPDLRIGKPAHDQVHLSHATVP